MPANNSRLPPRNARRSTVRPVSKVWMLSHECAGLAQAGGLGEAVAGLSKKLAADSQTDVSAFLPSHGSPLDSRIRDAYGVPELTPFIAQGHRTVLNGPSAHYLA